MSEIHEVFPYLRVSNAVGAIEYYQRAFGAVEKFRLAEPSGRVGHAELLFGDTTIMIADEFPEMGIRGPESIGGTSVTIHLHVENADRVLESAEKAGGEIVRPAVDQFYGERSGTVRDPFGHEWNVGHDIESVSPEEMQRRYDDMFED